MCLLALCCWGCVSGMFCTASTVGAETASGFQRQCRRTPPGCQQRLRTNACCVCRPPELLVDGIMSKAGDVFAFGVLLW